METERTIHTVARDHAPNGRDHPPPPAARATTETGRTIHTVACNHVLNGRLNRGLNLVHSVLRLKRYGAYCNQSVFRKMVLRARKPRVTALFFSTGSMVCTGAPRREEGDAFAEFVVELLRTRTDRLDLALHSLELVNIVCPADLGGEVDLDGLAAKNSDCVRYQRRNFPGAQMWHPANWTESEKITLLIFKTGKVVATGGKSRENNEAAIMRALPMIEPFISRQS